MYTWFSFANWYSSCHIKLFFRFRQVLLDQGVKLGVKVLQKIAYRCAERARAVQLLSEYSFEEGVAGHRVIISSDGGRIRLREDKKGPKTSSGRTRYQGAF